MKKITKILEIIFITLIFTTCVFSAISQENVSYKDKTSIQNQVNNIVNYVNQGNINALINMISPNANPELKNKTRKILSKNKVYLKQEIWSYQYVNNSNNEIEIKGWFSAQGIGWNIERDSDYFIFEKINNKWYLLDTNFYEDFGVENILKKTGEILQILLIFLLVSIVISAFWIWMLVDCLKREFENKAKWVLIILLLNIIGALLYFFIKRKKLKTEEKEKQINNNQNYEN